VYGSIRSHVDRHEGAYQQAERETHRRDAAAQSGHLDESSREWRTPSSMFIEQLV
jgi:hypothetical protein